MYGYMYVCVVLYSMFMYCIVLHVLHMYCIMPCVYVYVVCVSECINADVYMCSVYACMYVYM